MWHPLFKDFGREVSGGFPQQGNRAGNVHFSMAFETKKCSFQCFKALGLGVGDDRFTGCRNLKVGLGGGVNIDNPKCQ